MHESESNSISQENFSEASKTTKEKLIRMNKTLLREGLEQFNAMQNELVEFIEGLRKKYPDNYDKVLSYHTVSFSTPQEALEIQDFSGEDSLNDFIDRLYQKYIPEEKSPKE